MFEVYYYKRKTKETKLSSEKVMPFESSEYSQRAVKKSILLGASGEFIPVNKKPRLSVISVYPRE